jgi:glycosyltransferase involved in cell wall biosynthesis
MRRENITFATVTKPHLNRLKVLIPKVLPYVDRVVVVIGERDQKTEEYLKSFGDMVEIYYYKWHDNFAASWNAYLKQIEEGWVLICDDDEIPSDAMLGSLDDYINESARGENYCAIGFRCNPISEGQDMGPCNYYRQIFFRHIPGMRYASADPETGCHQCLIGYQNNRIIHSRDHEVYYHVKSLIDEYRNASRNYFIYSIWVSDQNVYRSEEWLEFKELLKQHHLGVDIFPEFDRLLIENTVAEPIKDWMVRWYKELHDHSERNEFRALVLYYFKYLHPEEAEKWGFVE